MSNSYTLIRPKSLLGALALWFFFGTIGIHRFYMHRTLAIPMLLLGMIGWIGLPFVIGLFILIPIYAWWLLDLFFVAGWVRDHNAAIGHG